jgi:predicted nucleic acid-binding protein
MVLADSNVLLRVFQRGHPLHPSAIAAVRLLHRGRELVLVPQNLVELWVVATRPTDVNGLGLTPHRAALQMARLNRTFPMLPETPDLHWEWQSLVREYQVSGKKAHDTRLVAAMRIHAVNAILTFNGDDFRRYSGIQVIHPGDLRE